jgi:photosystem II stability/assembly factor-like uncharacterized protein
LERCQHGPDGHGDVSALAIDPTTPGTLYAGTAGGDGRGRGVFKSTDGGSTWNAVTTGLFDNSDVLALAIDPTTPGTLYAATLGDFVFKSTDGGMSWRAVNSGLPAQPISALALDPTAPGTLYAGTGGGPSAYKSTDGAMSWQTAATGMPNDIHVHALVLDPAPPGALYAGTDGGVFKSTDGGMSWQAFNTGLSSFPRVLALTIDPTTPGTLYAGGYDGVFKSTDGGMSWQAFNNGLPSFPSVLALAIDPTAPGMLYAGLMDNGGVFGGGVFKSTVSASTWQAVIDGLPPSSYVGALAIDPTTPRTLYAGSDRGVFKSTDGGGTWAAAGTSFGAVRALALDASTPGALYAGTGCFQFDGSCRGDVFKSTDGGNTWSAADTGLPDNNFVRALAVDPSTPRTLYAGLEDIGGVFGGGVFKSTDGASTWQAIIDGLPPETQVGALAIDPIAPSTLYAGTGSCDVDMGCIGHGVFQSTDGGATWSGTGLTDIVTELLAIDPTTPGTLYAGTHSGVLKSTDGGGTWNAANTGLPATPEFDPSVTALAVDPSTAGTLYAGTYSGVFKSTDGGGTWAAFNAGLPAGAVVFGFALDPTPPARVYAGTSAGVFDIEQMPPSCIGDCSGTSTVAISDLVTLVNMALGDAQAACPNGVPSGAEVTVALIIQAVNDALNGCAATV